MGTKDIMLKNYFTPERFADMFNAIAFNGRRIVDPGNVTPWEKETDDVKVKGKGKDAFANWRLRDTIKVVELPDAVYCLMAIEHQIKAEPEMPLRVMEYDVREYLRQMREDGASKLKPIITLVIYWEGNEWSYATTLHEMFDETAKAFLEKTGIMKYLPDYRMNLFIPKAATAEELERFETDLKYVMMYVRYSDDKNKLMNYARENDIVLNIESVTIINALTNSNLKIEEGKDEVQMCKALDDLIEDGRNEGRSEGIEIGRQEGRQEGSIIGFITACREFDKKDTEIMELITEKYAITNQEAERLMKEA